MAKIFRLCAEYEQAQPRTGWFSVLRYFTRKPGWKRVARYNTTLRNIMEARSGHAAHPRRTTANAGINKRASHVQFQQPHGGSRPSPNRAPRGLFGRRQNARMDAFVQMVLSGKFLDDVGFVLQAQKRLAEVKSQCLQMRTQILSLRGQADTIEESLKAAQDRGDLEALGSADRNRQQMDELRSQALEVVARHNKVVTEGNNGRANFLVLCASIGQAARPYLEQAGLLRQLDEASFRARFDGPIPPNEILIDDRRATTTPKSATTEVNGEQVLSREQQAKDELRRARRTAFLNYENAEHKLESHRETYTQQVKLHRKGRSPGWPGWLPSWDDERFDVEHLRHAMHCSKAVRETEDELYKAMQDAHDGGVSPMLHWQISGFHDRPDDDPADSVRGGVDRDRIGVWGDGLPATPPNPEPYGPGVVQTPSDQMSELDRDVGMWETWSFREEDVQRKRLIDRNQSGKM